MKPDLAKNSKLVQEHGIGSSNKSKKKELQASVIS